MTKLYSESRKEQMDKKIHGMSPLHHENMSYQRNGPEDILKNESIHHSFIQLLAYQIYNKKGGTALDNWLEAERILRNNHHK